MFDKKENISFFLPLLFCVCLVLIRYFLGCYDGSVYETDLKGMVVSGASFPLGIIKEEYINGCMFSFYHFFIHILSYFKFSNGILIYRIFNTVISILYIGVVFNIAYKTKKILLGIFLIFYFALNHYFIYFSNQISPYCLNCLIFCILIYHLFDFLDFKNKISEKKLKKLFLICAVYCLADNSGILYVLSLFLTLFLLFKNKKRILLKYYKELKRYSYFYLAILLILISELVYLNSKLITDNLENVAINFNSFYLFINEFFSPYLSFNPQEKINQSTLGMLYTYFLNPDIKNVNSLKILITLFYSSILPVFAFLFFTIKAIIKNPRLKILFLISVLNLGVLFILFFLNYLDFNPKYAYQFFFTSVLVFSFGLFQIKDIYIKSILIFCLLIIQTVNPKLNSYYITINHRAPAINVFDKFKTDYSINENDLIIMPYLGTYAKKYYKKLNFFDYDSDYLKQKGKNNFLSDLISKEEPLNKKNIYFISKDYLITSSQNAFLAKYFIENSIKDDGAMSKVVLAIDKANQRIISPASISKFALNTEFNLGLRHVDLNSNILAQNASYMLFSALNSRTVYNFISLLNENFYLSEIVQYKKVQNGYYKVFSNKGDIYNPLLNRKSDYVFMIFVKRVL